MSSTAQSEMLLLWCRTLLMARPSDFRIPEVKFLQVSAAAGMSHYFEANYKVILCKAFLPPASTFHYRR